jgi:hypothetical protein
MRHETSDMRSGMIILLSGMIIIINGIIIMLRGMNIMSCGMIIMLRGVLRKLFFWAEEQQVAIPGWLREDQKEGLHQEEYFASRKQPRCPITKENEAKRRIPCWGVGGGGGGFQEGDPTHVSR